MALHLHMINDEGFICFPFASFMASTSQTHPISIFENIDIKEANLGVEIVWKLLFPFFQTNQATWAPHHHNTSFWVFFVPNNGGATTSCNPQQLWCIICHSKQTNVHALSGNTIPIKRFIAYNKENGTFTLSKHVACDHAEEFKRLGGVGLCPKATREEFWTWRSTKT